MASESDAGSGVYAVEAAVFGVIGLAWLSGREGAFGGSLLDFVCLSAVFYASLLSLVCGIFLHRGRVQCAYLSVVGGLWHLYLYCLITGEVVPTFFDTGNSTGCVANSDPRGLVRAVFFGGTPMHQIPSGMTLGLLTVDLLIAAGPVSDRLWRLCGWSDVAVLSVLALHASLCVRPGMVPNLGFGWSVLLWGLASLHMLLLLFDSVWQRLVVGPRVPVDLVRMWVHVCWILVLWLEFVCVWWVAVSQGLFGWGAILLFVKALVHRGIVVGAEVRVVLVHGDTPEASSSVVDYDTAPSAPRLPSITVPSASGQGSVPVPSAPSLPRGPAVPVTLPGGVSPGVKTLFSVVRFPNVRDKKRS